jgi:hypothetical protein
MNRIRYIRTSDIKINKTPNKMAITRRIRKRITISRAKLNIKLHRSLNNALKSLLVSTPTCGYDVNN